MSDDEYTQNLKRIEQIREHIKGTQVGLKLPQLVVIGDQSSGKSSNLSAITGVPLPNNSGTCTKQPIVVYTKRSTEDLCGIRYKIDDEVVAEGDLEAKILDIQAANLADKDTKVDATPITIHAEGADCWDLVLVDLPGIIANGEGKEEVVDMIRKYIADEQSLIIVVTEAQRDDESALALELAKEYDPEETRTLRVLTKFDSFDTDAAKTRASALVNKVAPLSAHAVVCRPGGKAYEEETERESLAEYDLSAERSGVKALRARLPALLNERIRTNLPGLKKQILDVLEQSNVERKRLGESSPDSTTVLTRVQKDLVKQGGDRVVGARLSPLLDGFRESIHTTKTHLTAALVAEHYTHNAFVCPFFQGEQVFNQLLEVVCSEHWTPLLDTLQTEIQKEMDGLFAFDYTTFPNVDTRLRKALDASWVTARHSIQGELQRRTTDSLDKERQFKTMNHYLTSKYQEKLVLPEELLDTILERVTSDVVTSAQCSKSTKNDARWSSSESEMKLSDLDGIFIPQKERALDNVRNNLREVITAAVEEHQSEFNRMSIDDQHKRRILAAITANWAVAHKNVVDNVLSDVRTTVAERAAAWLKAIPLSPEFQACASEDRHTSAQRTECLARIKAMQGCLCELEGVGQ
jgi:GTPase SAR1 family protein